MRSLGTGSRCLPARRASRSPHDAVSVARDALKQYLYHYARIRRIDGRQARLAELTTGALLLVASLLPQLRLAGRGRDLVLPELRDPRRHLSRRAMPLWPDSLLRRRVPP